MSETKKPDYEADLMNTLDRKMTKLHKDFYDFYLESVVILAKLRKLQEEEAE